MRVQKACVVRQVYSVIQGGVRVVQCVARSGPRIRVSKPANTFGLVWFVVLRSEGVCCSPNAVCDSVML